MPRKKPRSGWSPAFVFLIRRSKKRPRRNALRGSSFESVSDAVAVFGIPQLTNGLPAYINFTRNLIMEDLACLFDPKKIVVEIPGDIYVGDALISKLSALQNNGFRLSLCRRRPYPVPRLPPDCCAGRGARSRQCYRPGCRSPDDRYTQT